MTQQPTPRRVTIADIEGAIVSEHYFTGADGVIGAAERNERDDRDHEHKPGTPLRLLTLCVIVLRNGFTLVGKSACVDAASFDAEIGRKYAREDAMRQAWPLFGFLLAERIHHAPAVAAAVTVLQSHAESCEHNAPIWHADGNVEQAEASANNAVKLPRRDREAAGVIGADEKVGQRTPDGAEGSEFLGRGFSRQLQVEDPMHPRLALEPNPETGAPSLRLEIRHDDHGMAACAAKLDTGDWMPLVLVQSRVLQEEPAMLNVMTTFACMVANVIMDDIGMQGPSS